METASLGVHDTTAQRIKRIDPEQTQACMPDQLPPAGQQYGSDPPVSYAFVDTDSHLLSESDGLTEDIAAATENPGFAPSISQETTSSSAHESWELVQRVQAGDTDAFGQIYLHYKDMVFRLIYSRTGDSHLAEDLTSDTFERALMRIGTFEWQGRDFGAWLNKVARNLVADHYKSGRHRHEHSTGDMLDTDRNSSEGRPEDTAVSYMTYLALLPAIRQLTPSQRDCVGYRLLADYSVAETARIMGTSPDAVKVLQFRAVRSLARLMPNFGITSSDVMA